MGITQQIGASSLIKPGVINNAAARPASPYEGQVIFQKDTDQLLVWNGTAWVIPNSPAQNPGGLELVTTATCSSGGTSVGGITTIGTGVSGVVITCFDSTYDDYRIVIKNCAASAQDGLRFVIGSVTTGYYGSWTYALYNATATNVNPVNNQANMVIGLTDTVQNSFTIMDITNVTSGSLSKFFVGNYYGRGYTGTFGGVVSSTAAQTNFTISNGSGTLTGGTITVYGYRKS